MYCGRARISSWISNFNVKLYPINRTYAPIKLSCITAVRCRKYGSNNQKITKKEPCLTEEQFWSAKRQQGRTTVFYLISAVVGMIGAGFAAVPLYNRFCQTYNYGGTVYDEKYSQKAKNMKRNPNREIRIVFNADKSAMLQWNFRPLQGEIRVVPGETVLAFYTAQNPTDKVISGISTYNIVPFEAGQYFNKIQCFCFDEQQLNPREQVDMPVFFYVDPEFVYDPYMTNVDEITLSYTFFEAKEGLNLPFVSH